MLIPHFIEPLEGRIAPAFVGVLQLSALDGLNGFKMSGVSPDDQTGISVSGAGDVNGDGFDDLIIGTRGADANGRDSGASYVVFGKPGGFDSNLNLSTLNGANGFKISGEAIGDYSGISVSSAGDVNGDGFDDLIIGAPHANSNGISQSGASYVVFGQAGGFASNLNLSTLNGDNGFKLTGQFAVYDLFGNSVSAAGDVNGDGFDDLIIGARGVDVNGRDSGASYVVFGKLTAFAANLDVSSLNGLDGFKLTGVAAFDRTGLEVNSAGDVNGDGFDDLIIGAPPPYGEGAGLSYVVFGKIGGFAATLNLSDLDGSNGFKLSGVSAGDQTGCSVSGAGDVNSDGFDDLIIGARGADPNGISSGASYVVFGKASGFSPNLNLSDLNGLNGFKISGVALEDLAGGSASGAGDINSDGFDDLIIGALGAGAVGLNAGASYVVFGKADGFAANLNLATLGGADGFQIRGATGVDGSGGSVSGAGDVNGDGFDDLIIGAYLASPNGGNSGASYVVFGRSTATVSISSTSTSVEGAAGASDLSFSVSLSAASTVPITVRYSTQAGTAQPGSDFTGIGDALLTFAPGETSKLVTVQALGDTLHEHDETFAVVLSSPLNAEILRGTGIGIILNDDMAPVASITSASVLEGDSGTSSVSFVVNLSMPSGLPTLVELATLDGTALAGSDYIPLQPTVLTFAPGETSGIITVQVLGDTAVEDHERFSVALLRAQAATIGEGLATGTILNDDAVIRISDAIGGMEGNSGASSFVFTVSLEKPSALPVTVSFASAGGTAVAGLDYTALVPDTLIFAVGETSKTITMEVLGDTLFEADETFSIVLSDATNATIAADTAIGLIRNDDGPPLVTISNASVLEGDSGKSSLGFTVSLSAPSGLPATVRYAAFDGTAVAGSDYDASEAGAQITFAPGEISKTIMIEVLGDRAIEGDESFSLVLSDPVNATLSIATAIGTIRNDDTTLRISDAALLEGHAGTRPLILAVSLTAPSALPVSVNFASLDGTATGGSDYTALSPGTLTFAPGETNKTITVEIIGDTAVESTEVFSVILSGAVNAVLEKGTGEGLILDDDVTLVSARKATFINPDGDLVSIKVSKGELRVEDFTLFPSGIGSQLALVDFSGEPEFAGTNLTIQTKRSAGTSGGAGLVHVGYIDATGIDLGKVVVKGDLGQIDAGDALTPKRGLLSLSASSLGRFGDSTQLPGGSLQSDIVGALKKLKLTGGMDDATLSTSGDVGAIAMKGDVLGSGIRSDGRIGSVKIGGDLAASAVGESIVSARGALEPNTSGKALAIGRLSIGGSVDHAQILAGYYRSGEAVNPTAGIDAVIVGGDWIASNLVAGVAVGEDGQFGTDDDILIGRNNPVAAKIALVIIKGTADGTEEEGDHFGFVASEIRALRIGGAKHAFDSGPANDLAGHSVGSTGDLIAREIA